MIGPIRWALELLFPRRCMFCRCILSKEPGDLCSSCRQNAPEYPSDPPNSEKRRKNSGQFLDSFTAVWYYESDIRRSILRYKFRRAIYLAPKYAGILAVKLKQQEPFDLLVWVPVSPRRRFHRGYDQCELLAKALGRELGIPCQRGLCKHRHTPPQSTLRTVEERRANVLGVFRVCKGVDLRGKRVLLLDDIRTTGATIQECARVLRTAGAKEVHGATIAAVRNHKNNQAGE